MRPRSLRELTDMAREELAPNDDDRTRVRAALVATVAAGATLAASASAAASSASAGTASAASTVAPVAAAGGGATGGVTSAGAAAVGAMSGAAVGGGILSSGLMLKGLALLALVGGAGLLTIGDSQPSETVVIEDVRGDLAGVMLASEPTMPVQGSALGVVTSEERAAQENHVGHEEGTNSRMTPFVPSAAQAYEGGEPRELGGGARNDESSASGRTGPPNRGPSLVDEARRLQDAQRALAEGRSRAALSLLAAPVDPRLRGERLALRVLAQCGVGQIVAAEHDAVLLRALPDNTTALARISRSCVDAP